jgi:predicted AAA+ superfamily ATPase
MNVTNKRDNNAAEDKNESSHNSHDSKYSEDDTNMVSIENMSLKSCEEEVFYYYDSNDEIDCYVISKNNVNLEYSKESTDRKRSDCNISDIKTKKSKPENCSGKKLLIQTWFSFQRNFESFCVQSLSHMKILILKFRSNRRGI